MNGHELWTRRGIVVEAPVKGHRWWNSHAQGPTPLIIGPRHWRIYFSPRDVHGRVRMIFVDVDPLDDMRVLNMQDTPLLELGAPGAFDSAGQAVSQVVREGDKTLLYYIGVHLRVDVPYSISVGLAESIDGGDSFTRISDGPVVSISQLDPYFVSAINVSPQINGSSVAWYMSCSGWEDRPNGVHDPVYGLRRAVSCDGRHWSPTTVTVGLDDGIFDEPAGLTRPWVMSLGGSDRLWFSHRSRIDFRTKTDAAYRIMDIDLDSDGAPTGTPRRLTFANPPEPDDWDVSMQAYPAIMPLGDGYVMFYNGNGFGTSGFGWATLGL